MRTLFGIIIVYLLLGVAVVAAQVSLSPCDKPLALDAQHDSIRSARLDGTLINGTGESRALLAKDVGLWGVRFVQMVVTGDTSIRNFVLANQCRASSF